MQILAIKKSPKKSYKKKFYKISPSRNSNLNSLFVIMFCIYSKFYFRDILFNREGAGGAGAGQEPARDQGVFQMDGLPGRQSARGQRPGGSPWL